MQTATHTYTVLLIEDNPEDSATIRRYLTRDPKKTYDAIEVSSGADGLHACLEHPPDAILLDYYLPDMNGRVFLDLLQQQPDSALLPVVVLTGRGSEDLAIETLRKGAVEYITKDGLTPESLRLALHAAIEKGILRRQIEIKQAELKQTNRQLFSQQAQLHLALDAARMHTWEFDLHMTDDNADMADTNAKKYADTLLEETAPDVQESITGKPSLIHPDDRAHIISSFQGIIAGNRPYDLTYRLLRSDNTVRWINTRGNVICNQHGAPLRLIGISMDITAQKQLEEIVHQQRQSFQMIAENSPDIIARFDHELRHRYINPAATKASGVAASVYLGKTNRELGMPLDQVELWDTALQQVFTTGEEGLIEFSFPTLDGFRWYQSRLTPERAQSGEIVFVLAVARDVTALRQVNEDLLRSERRARRLMDSNIIGVIVSQDNLIIEANDAFLTLIGASRDDLEQHRLDWTKMTAPEYLPKDEQAELELQAQGACVPFEKAYLLPDGRRVPVLIGVAIMQQEPEQRVCFILDLSAQKQIEQERIRALAAFQTLADHAPDAITRHDATTFRYLYANPAVEQATGIPIEAFAGHTYRELGMDEALCLLFDQTLTRVVTTGQPTHVTYQDHGRHHQSLLVPEENAEHQLSSILVISHDITDIYLGHQKTKEALNALIKMAQVLIIPDGLISTQVRETGILTETSRPLLNAIRHTFGCTDAIMVILTLDGDTEVIESLVTSGFDRDTERELLEHTYGQPLVQYFEEASSLIRLHAGEVVRINMSTFPYNEQLPHADLATTFFVPMLIGSTLIGVITLYTDEYSRRFTEEEEALVIAMGNLAALLIERTRLSAESAEARAAERVAEAARSQMDAFLGIVSHELKTPLTAIKGNLQLAEQMLGRLSTQLSEQAIYQESITAIQTRLARATRQIDVQNRLVNDLIDISRFQNDQLELHTAPCDIITIVHDAIEDQRMLAPTRQIDFHTSVLSIQIHADAERIGQVIINYLTNALKYSEERYPVEVRIENKEHIVRVVVRDNGPGLSPEQQQHIWERFQRAPGIIVKSGSGTGLGLGLHISKQLIERQGGQVGVDSSPGDGSAFWFTLPRSS